MKRGARERERENKCQNNSAKSDPINDYTKVNGPKFPVKKYRLALAGVAQWIEHGLRTKGSLVRFPVKAHAWVAGQVPSRPCERQPHIDVFLPLFLFPFPSL